MKNFNKLVAITALISLSAPVVASAFPFVTYYYQNGARVSQETTYSVKAKRIADEKCRAWAKRSHNRYCE